MKLGIIGSSVIKSSIASLQYYDVSFDLMSSNIISDFCYPCPAPYFTENTTAESVYEDVNKTIDLLIKNSGLDYLIMDLLDLRLNVIKFSVEGKTYYATLNNSIKSYLEENNISYSTELEMFKLDDSKLEECIKKTIEKISESIDIKKVIVLVTASAGTFIGKDSNLYYLLKPEEYQKIKSFYNKIYALFRKYAPEAKYIDAECELYCDGREHKPFSFYHSKSYYEFVKYKVMHILTSEEEFNKRADESLNEYKKAVEGKTPQKLDFKPIVLKDFSGRYEDDFGNVIDSQVKIKEIYLNGTNNTLKISKCTVFNNNIFKLGNNNSIRIEEDNHITDNVFDLKNRNTIIFGKSNVIASANIVLIDLSSFQIGDQNILRNWTITAFYKSSIKIGNNNYMHALRSEIRNHNYTSLIIGNDCLFSYELTFLNGDGHSIYDLTSKTRTNDLSICDMNKRTIEICDHVWIGLKSIILNGSKIGSGSIVGVGSLVKKEFKENVCVAGVPARVIKENVGWVRDNLSTDFKDVEPYIFVKK